MLNARLDTMQMAMRRAMLKTMLATSLNHAKALVFELELEEPSLRGEEFPEW